ncbi:pyridoxal-phosphate-dependent aminotransferase family protein [Entomobacter blattae]|nr:alanine--glyoxylate aminotransferase family protein [Entomobacter blattae]
MSIFSPLSPPQRLLMGPGPTNTHPRILRAMAADMLGQFDPEMTDYMNQTMELYRRLFETKNQWTFLIDGSARAGIEAALTSLLEEGDKILILNNGRFGLLLIEIAERLNATIQAIDLPWGEIASLEQIEAAMLSFRPKVFACVHGDTSTTMLQPLEGIGAICQRLNIISYVDATATLGGMPICTDKWGIDIISAGLQKSMSGPPGSAPMTISERAAHYIASRSHTEKGIANATDHQGTRSRIRSNYFDLAMIMSYWSEQRLNHHTEATSMLYAAREAALILLEEGLEHVYRRHKLASSALRAGLKAMGLKLFGQEEHTMDNVTGIIIPEAVDDQTVRTAMRNLFEIEIGAAFGPLKGKIWRIGTMGYNAQKHKILHTLLALEAVLRHATSFSPSEGKALKAALQVYEKGVPQ